jgi:hypothetical protein
MKLLYSSVDFKKIDAGELAKRYAPTFSPIMPRTESAGLSLDLNSRVSMTIPAIAATVHLHCALFIYHD